MLAEHRLPASVREAIAATLQGGVVLGIDPRTPGEASPLDAWNNPKRKTVQRYGRAGVTCSY
jgi:hypothetical protein